MECEYHLRMQWKISWHPMHYSYKKKEARQHASMQWKCVFFRSDDCIFNPVSKAGGRQGRREEKEYNVQLSPMQVVVVMMMTMMMMRMMVMTMAMVMWRQRVAVWCLPAELINRRRTATNIITMMTIAIIVITLSSQWWPTVIVVTVNVTTTYSTIHYFPLSFIWKLGLRVFPA